MSWGEKQTKAKTPSIIWYEHRAVGEKIAEKSGLPLFDAGTDASLSQAPVIVCSIAVQGTGKNLQRYNHNFFTSLPPNGTTFEQTVGRTHRNGQQADEVVVEWLGHTQELAESMDKIIADANYVQESTGQRQKVLYARML